MSEKHIVHHRGSPRPDPSSHSEDDGAIVWTIGGIVVAGLFVMAFWQVILATTLALSAIGGLGAYIWKIQKHALLIRKELFLYNCRRARLETEKEDLEVVESRKSILSRQDFQHAKTHAEEQVRIAQEKARIAAVAVCDQIDSQEMHLQNARLEVLKRASKTKEVKLKKALTKIDSAIEVGNSMKEALRTENG